jgi:hypothetical protein
LSPTVGKEIQETKRLALLRCILPESRAATQELRAISRPALAVQNVDRVQFLQSASKRFNATRDNLAQAIARLALAEA